MTGHRDDTDFDTRLLTERAVQQVHAFHGDLVSRMLLAEQDGDAALVSKLRTAGVTHRCRDGSVAVTDDRLARGVLRDPRFTAAPTAPDVPQYTLACVDEVIRTESAGAAPEVSSAQDDVDAFVDQAVRAGRAAAEFDLVTDLIRPAVVDVLCDVLDIDPGRRSGFRRLTEQAAISLDAAVCPPRLPDAYELKGALRELRNLFGADALAFAVFGSELAVNLTTNTALGMFEEPPPADTATLVRRALLRDPPLRLHRLFADEPVDLAGHRIAANTRILVLNADSGGEPEDALAVAAHPRPASLAIAIAETVTAALRGHLGRLRPTGHPVRRLRAPVTRAVVRFPVAVTDHEVR